MAARTTGGDSATLEEVATKEGVRLQAGPLLGMYDTATEWITTLHLPLINLGGGDMVFDERET